MNRPSASYWQSFCGSMAGNVLRARAGGTLLEVLLSLIILSLILQTVVQVSAQVRLSHKLSSDSQQGRIAAMRWRTARLANYSWARGEEGEFPDQSLRWRLAAIEANLRESTEKPDDLWRALELSHPDQPVFFWRMTLRLSEDWKPASEEDSGPIFKNHSFDDASIEGN